jgi:cell division protease FtsH
VRRIVTDQYERAKKILLERQPLLGRVADALIEYETLDTADIDLLVSGQPLSRPPPVKSPPPPPAPPEKEAKRPGLLGALGGLPKAEPGKA